MDLIHTPSKEPHYLINNEIKRASLSTKLTPGLKIGIIEYVYVIGKIKCRISVY